MPKWILVAQVNFALCVIPVCPKILVLRVHNCECGYRTNRDVASGQVVLKRGLAAVGHIVKKPVEQAEETNAAIEAGTLKSDLGKPTL